MITLGPFRLHEVLGRGGMGAVWRGSHAAQAVPVAVKVLHGGPSRQPRYRRDFLNEAQAVAGLDHPGVVVVLDYGQAPPEAESASQGRIVAGSPFLAMELATGTLRDVRGGIGWAAVKGTLISLLDALGHAHARGVLHRDLKPTNVLAFPGGRFKLADFGLAEVARAGAQPREPIAGTPRYMAPEQLLGRWRDDGPWTDLYALGCLAWELASGAPPFTQSTTLAVAQAQLSQAPPPLRPRAPVPAGFEAWLLRLLQKEPHQRFQWAADASLALRQLPDPDGPGEFGILEPAERATGPVINDDATAVGLRSLAEPPPLALAWNVPPGPRPLPPLPARWQARGDDDAPTLLGAGLGLWGLRPVPFVGRRTERDALWRALGQVTREGRARLVLLHGPAGSGKTRIAEWISEHAQEVGAASVLEAVHSPMAAPSEGLPRMVSRFLRAQGLQGAELLGRAERALRTVGADDPDEWMGLAGVAADAGDAALPAPAANAAERHAIVTTLLRRLATLRPVIVRLDDVQWGSDALAFCAGVLRRREADRLPVLLLLTAREEALAGRPREAFLLETLLTLPGAARLEVAPLPPDDHRLLVERVLGLEGDLVRQVQERTAGNPLFAVQLVGDWVQRGVLQAGPRGFTLRAGEAAPLPDDIHHVWAAHVAALLRGRPPSFRTALEIAAALGLSVDGMEWEEACRAAGAEPPLDLPDLLARHRLARRTGEGFAFVHAMLRESLEQLAREGGRWAAHHLACAAVLDRRYAGGEPGAAERVAGHLLQAGRPGAAVDPLLRAASERRETSDYARALDLLERRERALHAAGTPPHDPRHGEGWVLRARVHLNGGRIDEVFEWAERARRRAESHGWTRALSESLRLSGDAARRRGDLAGAAALYSRCIGLLDRLDDPHGVAASLWGLGDVHRQDGRLDEARRCFDRSRILYARIADAHGVADHAIGVADVAWQSGDLEGAAAYYAHALETFRELGNRYGVARSLNGLGEVDRAAARLDSAREHYRESLAILERVQSADALFPRVNLGLVAVAAGDWDEGRARLAPLARELSWLGWRGPLPCTQAALLACHAAGGDWAAWDEDWAACGHPPATGHALEPDLAWALDHAARQAEAAGRSDRARLAFETAAAHWHALGRADEAAHPQTD